MIGLQRIEVEGKRFVLVEESAFERLCHEAGRAAPADDLPDYPKPDQRGRFPALQYARVSLARDLIRQRKAAGLSQQQLADLAGVRQETLSRIETGKHTATPATVAKITRALEARGRPHTRPGG